MKHEHSNSQVNLKSESDDLEAIRPDQEQKRVPSALSNNVNEKRISSHANDEEPLIDEALFKIEQISNNQLSHQDQNYLRRKHSIKSGAYQLQQP